MAMTRFYHAPVRYPSVVCRLFLSALPIAVCALAQQYPAIRVHPENPRYFLFRGKPLALITASEHYGSVMNRPFDYVKYLDDAAKHKITLTRTFLLFREQQSSRNPSSPCKPESPDYIAPFPRTGPGKAMDGEPVYDLDRWNPEYFDRLHRFLDAASKRGIVVELTVFSNTYADSVWALNPFRAENNLQKAGKIEWQDYISLKDADLTRRQEAYARKIVQETSEYDNVYYEICNEPGGGFPGRATLPDIDAWQAKMGAVLRDEMRKLNRPHLISGQQAFTYLPKFRFPLDETYSGATFDIVNVHPLPDTELHGKLYQLGGFMSKELHLAEVSDFCRMADRERKPTVLDEDNTASMYRDTAGWTIHRKRAWTALLNGNHYDYIDFSITVGSETGTAAAQTGIRLWMQHLSEFMAGFDYIHAQPDLAWVKSAPGLLVASALAIPGQDYALYLGDSRELTDTAAGSPIGGKVELVLPVGSYNVRLYSPVTGEYSPGITMDGGRTVSIDLGTFTNDIVVRATRSRS